MKSKTRLNHKHRRITLKSRVLSLLLLMMILLMIISQNSTFFYQNNDDKIKEKSQYDNINRIKSGTAHNATYFYNNNFSALPSCTGSGTYLDPYVIKNLEIDGEDKWGYPISKKDENGDPIVKDVNVIPVPYLIDEVLSIFYFLNDNKNKIKRK